VRWGWPPIWYWTRRQALADERLWRCHHDHAVKKAGWNAPAQDDALELKRIEAFYRQLRKALEDAKNEPGAADFYYAKMAMRRLAAPVRSVQRLLFTAYWRCPATACAPVEPLARLWFCSCWTVGFVTVGFAASERLEYRPMGRDPVTQAVVYRQVNVSGSRPGWITALDHSVESATSLLRGTQPRPLTHTGRVLEITLRLLGPLLLGLVILAVRSRVKR
jgi:hypothetical protein